MQKVAEMVERRLERISENLSESVDGQPLTAKERKAIVEAERLADLYADVTPEVTKISDSYLFRLVNSK